MIKGFAQVPNNMLWDDKLSFKAKGLWAYIKSKPPNWDFSASRIALETKESRKSILSGLKELETVGYLFRTKLPSGRVIHKIYPAIHQAPMAYEPPIPFHECREQIQKETGMQGKLANDSAQELVDLCSSGQVKRSSEALRKWIYHEKAKVPKGDS